MKEKIKKFFSKDNLFILICTLLIGLFVFLCVIYHKKDVDNMNNKSNINLVDDENNLNTSWIINNEGNLVGNNLFYSSSYINNNANGVSINVSDNICTFNGNSTSGYYDSIGTFSINSGIYSYKMFVLSGTTNADITQFKYGIYESSISGTSIPLHIDSGTVTLNANATYNIAVWFGTSNLNFNNLQIGFMLVNASNIPVEWEPYGIWYSKTNYDNLQTQNDIILSNINPLSVNNISSNSLVLNSIDVSNELQGSIFLSNLNGGLGFYNSDFDAYSSFNSSGANEFNLVSNFNNIYTIFGSSAFVSLSHSAEDFLDISFYRDNQLILSMNDLDSETTQEYMQTYSNMEIHFNKIIISGQYTSGVSNRQGTNYIIDNNNYAFGYQQGYKDSELFYDSENTRLVAENSQLTNDLNNLNNNYNSLNTNFNNLLTQYNNLANNEYTFSELFWSISSVPFGVLASGFNVNVLGVNLAAIITGLFTALLIIWLIKKFLK